MATNAHVFKGNYRQTLKEFIDSQPKIASRFVRGDKTIKDPLKLILRNVGLILVQCKQGNMKVETDLTKIYILFDLKWFPRLKFVQIGGDDTFQTWKNALITLYNSVTKAFECKDPEYDYFMEELGQQKDISGVAALLESWYFWGKVYRMRILKKSGEMMLNTLHFPISVRNKCKENFGYLVKWRELMETDSIMKTIISSRESLQIPLKAKSETDLNLLKIKELLIFIRTSLCHFRTTVQGFSCNVELVAYLDTRFPKLMRIIYEGCVLVDRSQKFRFHFEKMI